MKNYHDRIMKMAVNKMGASVTEYYAAAFQKIENGQIMTWNWSAFFLGAFWMFYRRMYIISLAVFYVMFALRSFVVPEFVVFLKEIGFNSLVDILTSSAYHLIFMLIFGLLGNKIYYLHLKWQVRQDFDLLDEKPVALIYFSVAIASYISMLLMAQSGVVISLFYVRMLVGILGAYIPMLYVFRRFKLWRIKIRQSASDK